MVNVLELRAEMARSGINQNKLAELIRVNKNTLSNKMTGHNLFSVQEAYDICMALGITDRAKQAEIFFAESVPEKGQQ